MAISAANHPDGHAVTLWARDAAQAAHMQATRSNARYLQDSDLPPALAVASGDAATLADRPISSSSPRPWRVCVACWCSWRLPGARGLAVQRL